MLYFFDHLAHILPGATVSASIPAAVGVNSPPLSNEFERNYVMEVVLQSTDLGCWPPEDVVAQANMETSALVHAVRNILFQLSKQCETQCALHTVLILEELLAYVASLSHGEVARSKMSAKDPGSL